MKFVPEADGGFGDFLFFYIACMGGAAVPKRSGKFQI